MTREELYDTLVRITGHEPICTIKEAEPIGPKKLLDVVAVVPCTGNTISKLANAITDTPVLMACKSHFREAAEPKFNNSRTFFVWRNR